MMKEGPLSSVHLLQLLGEIFTERFTGAMRLESGSQVRILYFKNGDIISCGTNVNAEKIDEVLLSLGKITRDHIREVLEMSASFSEIGKRMLSLGFLSASELDDALKYQTLLIVRNLIRSVDGSFSLVENYTPTRTDVFHYPTHHFISDFLRATDDRELVFSILPPPATKVRTLPGASAIIDTLPWGSEEKGLAANLTGKVTLAELTGLSRMREMDIYKLVAVLACLAAVEVAEGGDAPPTPPTGLPVEPENPFTSTSAAPQGPVEVPAGAPLSHEMFPQTRPGTRPDISMPYTHKHKARSRRLFVIYPLALIGIVLVGLGGVLAWQKLKPGAAQEAAPLTQPVPVKPAPIVLPEPKPAERPAGTGGALPVPEDEEADMVLAPPMATPPPAAMPKPAPKPEAKPPSAATAQPATTPTAPPAAAAAAPKPAPAAVPPPAAPAGKFADQARAHLARIQGLPATRLTLQLMIACQEDSIAKAQAKDPNGPLWFIPFTFKGKACYKVYWGDYSTSAAAQEAVAGLPDEFKSGKPQVVSLGAALKNASP